jgi:transposase
MTKISEKGEGRKTEREKKMRGNCIAIDVSKDKSHIQGFRSLNEPIFKAMEIGHDREGFEKILEQTEMFGGKEEEKPKIIFEATGIYHRGLQSYLEQNGFEYYIVNPLQSAKCRKQDLRTKKTDKRDCVNLAKMFYTMELRKTTHEDENYYTLRQLSRHYEDILNHLRKTKVSFNATLDIVYPKYQDVFGNLYTNSSIAILRKYPHPDELGRKHPETVAKQVMRCGDHTEAWCIAKAERLIAYAKTTVSGCKATDINVRIMVDELEQVERYLGLAEKTLREMIQIAETIPNYKVIRTIPGIGENLAARLLAEIGDISRFLGSKQLVAYAGIDPIIYQSGQMDGLHLKISKKGNKRLRCLLYLAVFMNLHIKKETNTIREFFNKKTRQASPLCAKAASVACANKLLRIIYGMCKTGTVFK